MAHPASPEAATPGSAYGYTLTLLGEAECLGAEDAAIFPAVPLHGPDRAASLSFCLPSQNSGPDLGG